MSHLKDSIRAIALARPLAPLRLSLVPKVMEAAERIPPRDGTDKPRPHKDYQALARQFLDDLMTKQPLTSRELRDAAWCLWTTTPALAEHPDALRAVLGLIERSERRPPGRALASSYMTGFEPARPGIQEISATLRRIAARLGRPWADLQRELQLFHWQDGPQSVAQHALDGQKSPGAVLREGGLGTLNAQSGFARACSAATLERLADMPGLDASDRLTLVKDLALDERGRLVFDDHAPLVANALVLPFGEAPPDKAVRDRYLDLLLDLFNDPRLPQSRWMRMPQAAEQVRRWLTEQSLRQFLDVVDEVLDVLDRPAEKRMWKYRRAFWEAVYRAELISEAWVVFDRMGEKEAQQRFGRDISFAKFDGGVQRGHAVLLLRIGRGIVAEWSFSGKYIIWTDAEAVSAPKLYKNEYPPDVLREPTGHLSNQAFAGTHFGSEKYSWQLIVAEKIKEITNMRIPRSAYEVQ